MHSFGGGTAAAAMAAPQAKASVAVLGTVYLPTTKLAIRFSCRRTRPFVAAASRRNSPCTPLIHKRFNHVARASETSDSAVEEDVPTVAEDDAVEFDLATAREANQYTASDVQKALDYYYGDGEEEVALPAEEDFLHSFNAYPFEDAFDLEDLEEEADFEQRKTYGSEWAEAGIPEAAGGQKKQEEKEEADDAQEDEEDEERDFQDDELNVTDVVEEDEDEVQGEEGEEDAGSTFGWDWDDEEELDLLSAQGQDTSSLVFSVEQLSPSDRRAFDNLSPPDRKKFLDSLAAGPKADPSVDMNYAAAMGIGPDDEEDDDSDDEPKLSRGDKKILQNLTIGELQQFDEATQELLPWVTGELPLTGLSQLTKQTDDDLADLEEDAEEEEAEAPEPVSPEGADASATEEAEEDDDLDQILEDVNFILSNSPIQPAEDDGEIDNALVEEYLAALESSSFDPPEGTEVDAAATELLAENEQTLKAVTDLEAEVESLISQATADDNVEGEQQALGDLEIFETEDQSFLVPVEQTMAAIRADIQADAGEWEVPPNTGYDALDADYLEQVLAETSAMLRTGAEEDSLADVQRVMDEVSAVPIMAENMFKPIELDEDEDEDGLSAEGVRRLQAADDLDEGEEGEEVAEVEEEEEDFQERIIELRRVTKVVKGGKLQGFRCISIIGNGKGKVGVGVDSGREIATAVKRSLKDAKLNVIAFPLVGANSLPHRIEGIHDAARVVLVPAADGTGCIAGGAVRSILEVAGVENVLSKILGSRSALNNCRATINGLSRLRTLQDVAKQRGVPVEYLL